ncbi:MAG: hypothetical protein AB7U38_14410, partial [Hyphomicrobiales bacterium]
MGGWPTRSALNKPPFRADHVGSLLRPAELLAARYATGGDKPAPAQLEAMEDALIPDVIALQERLGLQGITDGEFRRASFRSPVVSRVDGFTTVPQDPVWAARDAAGHSHALGDAPVAVSKLVRNRSIAAHEARFVKQHTSRTVKVTLPAPSYHCFYRTPDPAAYPDMDEYLDDLVRIYREELAELASAGVDYVQFDEVIQAYLCDERIRAIVRRRGDDPDDLSRRYVDLINRIVEGRSKDMTVAVHFCRGNSMGRWVAEGGYDAIAEAVFGGLNADALFMEYDSPRAGDFAPLRYVSPDKVVVL